jgi:hypothetical protein
MPVAAGIVAGGALLGGVVGAQGAKSAARTQAAANDRAIAAQAEAANAAQEQMSPYSALGLPAVGRLRPYEQAGFGALPQLQQLAQAGIPALQAQMSMLGLQGPQAQQQAYQTLAQDPQFLAMQQQGQNALLQNASATGGLRGGNTQAALAQFSPQLLNQVFEQRYGQLGQLAAQGGTVAGQLAASGLGTTQNIAGMGQASAAGQAANNMQLGTNTANLLVDQGAARAGGQLGVANALSGAIGGAAGAYGAMGAHNYMRG